MHVKRALLVPCLLGALTVTAACGAETPTADDEAGAERPAPTATPTPREVTAPGNSVQAVDDIAVDPPGPLRDAEASADILVVSKTTLDPEMVESVRRTQGVTAVETVSLAQFPIENRVLNVAAVDAGGYRRFTPTKSANFQEQWDRVAGGEIALDPALVKKLPIDDEDFLELGLDGDGDRVHIGAYYPQVEQVDAVINTKWGEALGMTPDNALLISTGKTAPDAVRAPLQKVVGAETSLQNLDVVAREGLDPNAFQTAVLVGSFADAVGTYNYTPIGGGLIRPDPAWVRDNIATETVPILGSVTCNKALFPQLKAALGEIVQQGLADEINPGEYAGCYYPRFIAGSTTLSNHSFGLALDLNTPGNQRGTVGEMDRGVVAIFKRWGFGWGGDWRFTDPMHFELNRIVSPG